MSLTVGQMFAGVLAYDSLVYKAAGETYVTRRIETRLFKALATVYTKRAREGVKKAIEQFEASGTYVDQREVGSILDTVASAFAGWDKEVEPLVRVATAEIYRAAKSGVYSRKQRRVAKAVGGPAKGSKVLELKPKFDLVDKDAVETLASHQMFWIAGTYEKALSSKIATVANSVIIEQGLSREKAAKVLEAALAKEFGYDLKAPFSTWSKPPLPTGWRGSGLSYIEGLTSNAATTARVHGAVKGFTELGVTRYEVMVAGDERTCSRCKAMGERTFTVESAQKITISVLAAESPEDVKNVRPWPSEKQINDLTDGKSKSDEKTNAKLAKAGMSVPPFHYKCRCFIDIAEDTEFIPDAVEDGEDETSPVPATPVAPVEMAPEPGAFPWKTSQLTPVNKSLSGMHTKLVFKDPDGNEWIFKPQDEFRALGDKAAADLATLFGRDTADVYLYTHKGQIGSIQKVFNGVTGDLGGLLPEALSAANVLELQKEHLFDWLISQHDTHRENVLQVGTGLKFIDKGQAFRFFGLDKLNYKYGGSGDPNPVETYYHRLFSDYASGRAVNLAKMASLEDFLKRVESISDEALASAIRPYASAAVKAATANPGMKSAAWMGRFKNEDEFIASVLARKGSLRDDVEKFYKELEKERKKNTKAVATKLPKVAPARGAVFKKALEDARKSGWVGKSIMVRGADYEDMTFLMYGTEGDGTFLESKLRPLADKRLRALIGLGQESTPWDTSAPYDSMFNDVLQVTKSFNHHLKAGSSVPQHTQDLAEGIFTKLSFEADKGKANFYLAHMNSIYKPGGEWKKDGVGKLLNRYEASAPELKKGSLPDGWKATLVNEGDPISRKMVDGKIVFDKGGKTKTYLDEISPKSYKLEAPDGNIEVYYRPHEGTGVAGQGQFKVWMKKPISELTEKEVESAMAALGKLGLETELASKADIELMYLRKLAFKEKWDIITDVKIGDSLAVDDQIAQLKEFMAAKGVKFGKGYKPSPIFDRDDETGWPRWMSHHTTTAQTSKFSLIHQSQNGIPETLDALLESKTRALVPTFERLRVGIPIKGGMSPEEDLRTGGASYVFTRIREVENRERAFHFKGELLKDMSAVSHDSDRFGRFSDREQRMTSKDWTRTANRDGNETIFKHDLPLDYLSKIQVYNEIERKQVLEVFRKHGIKELAGKKVEDLVVTGGS